MKGRLGFVVQRYGKEVVGGSELLCRLVAERLARAGWGCTVYTTTALDYVAWANRYPEGRSDVDGIAVERFRVERARDIVSFNAFSDEILFRPRTEAEELEWMERQGPVSPGLVEAVRRAEQENDRLVFFTYLYWTAYWGLKAVAAGRHLLVPTAHEEPAIGLGIMREVFSRPGGFVFNTAAERELVERRFGLAGKAHETAGVGIDPPGPVDGAGFRAKFGIERPYVLYAGRIEPGKGCAELLDHFLAAAARRPGLDLLLVGTKLMDLPDDPRVRYLGFVSPAEKTAAMAGAVATIHPSHYESLCMAALESLAVRTPILVQAGCPPLKEHCLAGRCGLWYSGRDDFAEALGLLARDGRLREALGRNGREYVLGRYTWEIVTGKYEKVLKALPR